MFVPYIFALVRYPLAGKRINPVSQILISEKGKLCIFLILASGMIPRNVLKSLGGMY